MLYYKYVCMSLHNKQGMAIYIYIIFIKVPITTNMTLALRLDVCSSLLTLINYIDV